MIDDLSLYTSINPVISVRDLEIIFFRSSDGEVSSTQWSPHEYMLLGKINAPKLRSIGASPYSVDNECSGDPPVCMGNAKLFAKDSAGNWSKKTFQNPV